MGWCLLRVLCDQPLLHLLTLLLQSHQLLNHIIDGRQGWAVARARFLHMAARPALRYPCEGRL